MAHPEQLAFCQSIKDRYPDYFHQVRVLDVGSLNINGSNGVLFTDARYLGVDVAPGRNVDVVTPAHLLQLPADTFDVVISTECFEHDQHLPETLTNIMRMLRPGGLFLFTCATEGRPEHGTRATTPADAPLLQSMGTWGDYYGNVTEATVRGILDLDLGFSEYAFATNPVTHDLYFHGFKVGPRPLSKANFEPLPGAHELHLELRRQRRLARDLTESLDIERCVNAVAEVESRTLRRELELLRGSTSWRLTRPLRLARLAALRDWDALRGDLSRSPAATPSSAAGPPSGADTGADRAMTILTPPHTDYVAHCLARVLRQESIAVSIERRYDPQRDRGQHYLVIAPQVQRKLPARYFAFQMEQTINPRWFTSEYLDRLRGAEAVLDYSRTNLAVLQRLGLPYQRTFLVPILPTAGYRHLLRSDFGYPDSAPPERPDEVVFYGDPNSPRRLQMLEALRAELPVRVVSERYGPDLLDALRSAAVIVNIHYYEGALLETTRLSQALSLGIPVVSEEAANPEEYKEFRGVVDFVPSGDAGAMVSRVRGRLRDRRPAERHLAAVGGSTREHNPMDDMFRRFLFAQGLISFPSLLQRTSLEAATPEVETPPALPSFCVTLSETPRRRRAFLSHERPEFALLEGVRHATPWIGCGLSYKYLFARLGDRFPAVAVCEDDVEFPPDFDRRWAVVQAHLARRRGHWDVFAGLIADVHPDTRVLDVEDVEGEAFITIDRMTSMVFNVYTGSAMRMIGEWDERNVDAETNTIDRYIERRGGLRVLTVLPYLVGHSDSQDSTLWGFANSTYREKFLASNATLQEKVGAFRAEQEARRAAQSKANLT